MLVADHSPRMIRPIDNYGVLMMRNRDQLTIARLHFVLDYDPITGAMTWRNPTGTASLEGGKAGTVGSNGRRYIAIDGRKYLAHRLAWMYVHGKWPDGNASAKNGDYDDLRIENYEDISLSATAAKGGPRRGNTSGHRGITWVAQRQRWVAYITHKYKRIHVGHFRTIEEAVLARDHAVANLGLMPVLDKSVREDRAAKVSRTARLRVVWRKTLRQTGGVVGWASFEDFAKEIGDPPPGGRMILVPIDPDKTLGPANFVWQQAFKWSHTDPEGKLAYARQHRDLNRNSYRDKALRKAFGIGLDGYNEMLSKQGGVCAVCSKPETVTRDGKPRWLAVDHCHETGKIRGLLCTRCNNGLGQYGDDPELLRSAAIYLRHHKTQ